MKAGEEGGLRGEDLLNEVRFPELQSSFLAVGVPNMLPEPENDQLCLMAFEAMAVKGAAPGERTAVKLKVKATACS